MNDFNNINELTNNLQNINNQVNNFKNNFTSQQATKYNDTFNQLHIYKQLEQEITNSYYYALTIMLYKTNKFNITFLNVKKGDGIELTFEEKEIMERNAILLKQIPIISKQRYLDIENNYKNHINYKSDKLQLSIIIF